MPLKELAARNNTLHRDSDAQTVLAHALEDPRLGDTAVVSSFGAESVVLLHMVSDIDRTRPILFLDTEMLFPETLTYQADLAKDLGLTDVRILRPDRTALFEKDNESLLHLHDPDACCALRKSQPLEAALAPFGSWITGRKRFQSQTRSDLPVFEKAGTRIKVNPLAPWSAKAVTAYIDKHDLPRHPLLARGFRSIGCAPCTTPMGHNEAPRAGRWRDQPKTECGLHSPPDTPRAQIERPEL